MHYRTQKIGPTQATKLLETTKNNRPVSQATVERYANDMKNGKWRMTGQPIIISDSGNLLDGQHRLWAIVQSEAEVEVMVVTGVADDAIWSIDTGRSRTIGQVLHMNGTKHANRTAAVARTIDIVEYGNGKRKLSVDDYRAIMQRHKGISWIMEQPNISRSGPFCTAGVLAAFALLWEKNKEEAEKLWPIFWDGADLGKGDPFLTVRQHLTNNIGGRGGNQPSVSTCRRVLTAIAYRMRGEKMATSYDSQEGVKSFFPVRPSTRRRAA